MNNSEKTNLNDARKIGYKSINLDLIYGLPLQTKSLFSHTLEEVLNDTKNSK